MEFIYFPTTNDFDSLPIGIFCGILRRLGSRRLNATLIGR